MVPLLVTRPLATPLALRPRGTLRPLEDILALLIRAGFSGPDALHVYRALFGFLNGHVLNELQELVENPDETDDLLRLGLNRLPLSEFPLLRGLAHALASYDGAAELERGLDILLTGLATTLSPVASRPGRAGAGGRMSQPRSVRKNLYDLLPNGPWFLVHRQGQGAPTMAARSEPSIVSRSSSRPMTRSRVSRFPRSSLVAVSSASRSSLATSWSMERCVSSA